MDCLISQPKGTEVRFCKALAAEHLTARPEDFEDARADRFDVTVHEEQSHFHVDCKIALGPEELDQVNGAKDLSLGQGQLRIARAEDTVAYKVLFGSPRDEQDVRSILIRQKGRLHLERLRLVAKRLGVAERVEELLHQYQEQAHGEG